MADLEQRVVFTGQESVSEAADRVNQAISSVGDNAEAASAKVEGAFKPNKLSGNWSDEYRRLYEGGMPEAAASGPGWGERIGAAVGAGIRIGVQGAVVGAAAQGTALVGAAMLAGNTEQKWRETYTRFHGQPEVMEAINKKMVELRTTTDEGANAIGDLAATFGRFGVEGKDMPRMLDHGVVAMDALSLKAPAAAALLSEMRMSWRLSTDEMKNALDTMTVIGDKVGGADHLATVMMRTSAAAKRAGYDFNEWATIVGSLSAGSGQNALQTANQLTKILQVLEEPVDFATATSGKKGKLSAKSEEFIQGLKEIGYTAKGLAEDFHKDKVGTLTEFLKRIDDNAAKEGNAVERIFGKGMSAANLKAVADQWERIGPALKDVQKAQSENIAQARGAVSGNTLFSQLFQTGAILGTGAEALGGPMLDRMKSGLQQLNDSLAPVAQRLQEIRSMSQEDKPAWWKLATWDFGKSHAETEAQMKSRALGLGTEKAQVEALAGAYERLNSAMSKQSLVDRPKWQADYEKHAGTSAKYPLPPSRPEFMPGDRKEIPLPPVRPPPEMKTALSDLQTFRDLVKTVGQTTIEPKMNTSTIVSEAKKAESALNEIPKSVSVNVTAPGLDAIPGKVAAAKAALNSLGQTVAGIGVRAEAAARRAQDAASDRPSGAPN